MTWDDVELLRAHFLLPARIIHAGIARHGGLFDFREDPPRPILVTPDRALAAEARERALQETVGELTAHQKETH